MDHRIKEMQTVLARKKASAAVFRLPENIVLFSGYWPRNGFSFLFIPAEGEAHLLAPQGDRDDPDQGSITNIDRFGWVRLKDGNPFESAGRWLTSLAQKYGLKPGATILADTDFDACAPPLCSGEILLPGRTTKKMITRALDTSEINSAFDDLSAIRAIKNDTDIEKLERCNVIALYGLDRFSQLTERSGLREIDIAAEVEAAIAKQASGYQGATYGKAWAQISSGKKTTDAWFAGMVTSDRKIETGDFVMLEMATVVDGYWSDLTRTQVVGPADSRQQEMLDVVRQAQQAAVAAVQDGVAAAQIDRTARDVIEAAGLGDYFVHITGHGLGFGYHEAMPMIAPQSEDILQTGMVHTVEPGIYIPDIGGVRMETNIVVGVDGARELGRNPA